MEPRNKRTKKSKSVGDISDDAMRRRRSSTFKGDMLQIRLLQMEEKYRSQFLYDQLGAFEDKVYRSFDQFNVDALHTMYIKLVKITVVDVRKVKTLGHLRKCHMDLKKLLKCKRTHRNVKSTPEEEQLVNYFNWFFQFFDYLRQLRYNFVDRIFTPLFRYFYHVGYDRPDREDTTDSAASSPSVMSFRSHDSGFSDLSGLTSVLGGNGDRVSLSARSGIEETQKARKKIVTKQALLALSKEFQDIQNLYDTTEIEKLAQRLSHLKDRTDQLLDKENSLDKDLLAQDSEGSVFHLKIKEIGSFNVMRLVPDILLKFQKAAWLARRWLENDDEKTKDLNAKLEKLTALEEDMNKRLSSLSKEIQVKEMELESHVDTIGVLLKKEDRSNNLSENVYVLQKNENVLQDKLELLNTEREQLCAKLTNAVKTQDKNKYGQLRPLYDRNKLQRFAIERQIAGLKYHVNIIESDMNVELETKADVIHTTNDIQDKCEEIEQQLEKAKQEQKAIQAALIPISEDRKHISEQIQVQDGMADEDEQSVFKAEFIGSKARRSPASPDRMDDRTGGKYNGRLQREKAVSLFITSLPGEGSVTSVEKSLKTLSPRQSVQTLKSAHPMKKLSPVQPIVNQQFVSKPMKTLSPINPLANQQYVPELCDSEW